MNIKIDKIDILKWLVNYAKLILLVALLIYVASVRFGLHKNAELIHQPHSSIQWLQPAFLDEKFPLSIGNNNWSINYSNIERNVWESKVSATGLLVIDAETADLLQKISAELPASLNSKDLQRLTLLIERSLPDSDGVKIADLITRYYHYLEDYSSSLAEINMTKGVEKLSLIKASRIENKRRQEHYFGVDLAKTLFDRKNITTNYLNDRRIINMDRNLSKADKEEQLSALKTIYARKLSH